MEKTQQALQNLYKNKQNDILVKNSQFARLLKQLEDVTNSTSAVENEVAMMELKTKDMVSNNKRRAAYHIYNRPCFDCC